MEQVLKPPGGKQVRMYEPELYVNNQIRGRSGHMSHGMVEYAPGKVLDFNSNCSGIRLEGHSALGWIEMRFSEDAGRTWSEIIDLAGSKKAFEDGVFTYSIEKVVAHDGVITACVLRNLNLRAAEPWDTPCIIRSFDGGKSWTELKEMTPFPGRIYDMVVRDGVIYALEFCNDASMAFFGYMPYHVYRLYHSIDNGESFHELSVVPINGFGRGYGALQFRPNGSLVAYAYNCNRENYLDYTVSQDCGNTWEQASSALVDKKIRNPQVGYFDGVYVLHGRSVGRFVLYLSDDGINWSEGAILEDSGKSGYYSNNITLNDNGKNYLLIQYSESYEKSCVNVMHRRLEVVL